MKLPKIHFESKEIKIPLSEELRSPRLKKEKGKYQVTGSGEDSPVTHTLLLPRKDRRQTMGPQSPPPPAFMDTIQDFKRI